MEKAMEEPKVISLTDDSFKKEVVPGVAFMKHPLAIKWTRPAPEKSFTVGARSPSRRGLISTSSEVWLRRLN